MRFGLDLVFYWCDMHIRGAGGDLLNPGRRLKMAKRFKKGDRVRLSAQGVRALGATSRFLDRLGTVRSDRDDNVITVLWDGNRSISRYHKDFLELVEATP
jgi:hypothetical protein